MHFGLVAASRFVPSNAICPDHGSQGFSTRAAFLGWGGLLEAEHSKMGRHHSDPLLATPKRSGTPYYSGIMRSLVF
jgi:hypothetical protein